MNANGRQNNGGFSALATPILLAAVFLFIIEFMGTYEKPSHNFAINQSAVNETSSILQSFPKTQSKTTKWPGFFGSWGHAKRKSHRTLTKKSETKKSQTKNNSKWNKHSSKRANRSRRGKRRADYDKTQNKSDMYKWKFNLNASRYENYTLPIPPRSEDEVTTAISVKGENDKYLEMAIYVEGNSPDNSDLQNAWGSVGNFLKQLFGSEVDIKESKIEADIKPVETTSEVSTTVVKPTRGRSGKFLFDFFGFGGRTTTESTAEDSSTQSDLISSELTTQNTEKISTSTDIFSQEIETNSTQSTEIQISIVEATTEFPSDNFSVTVESQTIDSNNSNLEIASTFQTSTFQNFKNVTESSQNEANLSSTTEFKQTESTTNSEIFTKISTLTTEEDFQIVTESITSSSDLESDSQIKMTDGENSTENSSTVVTDSKLSEEKVLEEKCMKLFQKLQNSPRFIGGFFDFFGSGAIERDADSEKPNSSTESSQFFSDFIDLISRKITPDDFLEEELLGTSDQNGDRGARFLGFNNVFGIFGSGRQADSNSEVVDFDEDILDGISAKDCEHVFIRLMENRTKISSSNTSENAVTISSVSTTEITDNLQFSTTSDVSSLSPESGQNASTVASPKDERSFLGNWNLFGSGERSLQTATTETDEFIQPTEADKDGRFFINNWSIFGSGERSAEFESSGESEKIPKRGRFLGSWFRGGSGRSLDMEEDERRFLGAIFASGGGRNVEDLSENQLESTTISSVDERRFLGSLLTFGSGAGRTGNDGIIEGSGSSDIEQKSLFGSWIGSGIGRNAETTSENVEKTDDNSAESQERFFIEFGSGRNSEEFSTEVSERAFFGIFGITSGDLQIQDSSSDNTATGATADERFLDFGSGIGRINEKVESSDIKEGKIFESIFGSGENRIFIPATTETISTEDTECDDCDFGMQDQDNNTDCLDDCDVDFNTTDDNLIGVNNDPSTMSTNDSNPQIEGRSFINGIFWPGSGDTTEIINFVPEVERTTFIPPARPMRGARLHDDCQDECDFGMVELVTTIPFQDTNEIGQDSDTKGSIDTVEDCKDDCNNDKEVPENSIQDDLKSAEPANSLEDCKDDCNIGIEVPENALQDNQDNSFVNEQTNSVGDCQDDCNFGTEILPRNSLQDNQDNISVKEPNNFVEDCQDDCDIGTEILPRNVLQDNSSFKEQANSTGDCQDDCDSGSEVLPEKTLQDNSSTSVKEHANSVEDCQDDCDIDMEILPEKSLKDNQDNSSISFEKQDCQDDCDFDIVEKTIIDTLKEDTDSNITSKEPASSVEDCQDDCDFGVAISTVNPQNIELSTNVTENCQDDCDFNVDISTSNQSSDADLNIKTPISSTAGAKWITEQNATEIESTTADAKSTSGNWQVSSSTESTKLRFCTRAGQCNTRLNERCVTTHHASICNCGRGFIRHPLTRKCEDKIVLEASLRFPLEPFHLDLSNADSELFKETEKKARETMTLALSLDEELLSKVASVNVAGFSEGSLIIHWNLVVASDGNETVTELVERVDNDLREAFREETIVSRAPLRVRNAIINSISSALDLCQHVELNYCSRDSECIMDNSRASGFLCKCKPGYRDFSEDKEKHPGEICKGVCTPEDFCGKHGDCRINDNLERECSCRGWYFGQGCQLSGVVIMASAGVVNFLIVFAVFLLLCLRRQKQIEMQRRYGSSPGITRSQEFGMQLCDSSRIRDILAFDAVGPAKVSHFAPIRTPQLSPIPRLPSIHVIPASISDGSYSFDSTFDTTPSDTISPQISITSIKRKT